MSFTSISFSQGIGTMGGVESHLPSAVKLDCVSAGHLIPNHHAFRSVGRTKISIGLSSNVSMS